MNLELSAERTAVRQLAKDFTDREIAPSASRSPGTSQMQKLVIGRALTGVSAF
ncbi:hypothetical protein [Streptomyces platensis]|uniref:hypothetical protein n=1 Tax=Streptomyces platensis TaxID=58346 RepID=UPI003333D358